MQTRTAPPFLCYLWHFFWALEPFCDKTGSVIVCKSRRTAYRLVKSRSVVWLYAIVCAMGITASVLLALPRVYNGLLFLFTVWLGFVLCALYSYRHTTFEELHDDKKQEV